MAFPKKKLQSRDDGNQNASYNNDSMDMLMGDDSDAAPTKAGAPPSPDGDSRDLGSPDIAAAGAMPAAGAGAAPSPAAPVTITPSPDGAGFLVSATVGTREEAMALAGQLMGGGQQVTDALPGDVSDQGAAAPIEP